MEQRDDERRLPHAAKLFLRRKRLQSMVAMSATATQALREQRVMDLMESFEVSDPTPCDLDWGDVEASAAQWVIDSGVLQRNMNVPLELENPILQAIHKQYKIFSVKHALNWIRRFDTYSSSENWYALCRTIGIPDESTAAYLVYWLSAYMEVVEGVAEAAIEIPSVCSMGYVHACQTRRYAKDIYDPSWSLSELEPDDFDPADEDGATGDEMCTEPDACDESPVDTDVEEDDFANVPRMAP